MQDFFKIQLFSDIPQWGAFNSLLYPNIAPAPQVEKRVPFVDEVVAFFVR